jgi:hypothetical protein
MYIKESTYQTIIIKLKYNNHIKPVPRSSRIHFKSCAKIVIQRSSLDRMGKLAGASRDEARTTHEGLTGTLYAQPTRAYSIGVFRNPPRTCNFDLPRSYNSECDLLLQLHYQNL